MIETILYNAVVFMLVPFVAGFLYSRHQHQRRIRQQQRWWDRRVH